MNDEFDKERIVNHWIESSEKDFKTMIDLYQTQNNNWALFMGHLVIEKLLKALYVKSKGEFPPMIHDLRRICEKADIELDLSRQILLDSISRFNINARYDDYKMSFQKTCTAEFSGIWIEELKNKRIWIKELVKQ